MARNEEIMISFATEIVHKGIDSIFSTSDEKYQSLLSDLVLEIICSDDFKASAEHLAKKIQNDRIDFIEKAHWDLYGEDEPSSESISRPPQLKRLDVLVAILERKVIKAILASYKKIPAFDGITLRITEEKEGAR